MFPQSQSKLFYKQKLLTKCVSYFVFILPSHWKIAQNTISNPSYKWIRLYYRSLEIVTNYCHPGRRLLTHPELKIIILIYCLNNLLLTSDNNFLPFDDYVEMNLTYPALKTINVIIGSTDCWILRGFLSPW